MLDKATDGTARTTTEHVARRHRLRCWPRRRVVCDDEPDHRSRRIFLDIARSITLDDDVLHEHKREHEWFDQHGRWLQLGRRDRG